MKLNLGCGAHPLDGWLNIDDGSHFGVMPNMIRHDLSKGLPRGVGLANSVDYIYTEHFIEHLTKPQAVILLNDCLVALKPGGVMRISTPNMRWLAAQYIAEDVRWCPEVWRPSTPCDMINEGMRLWGHQYLWDLSEMYRVAKTIGFSSVVGMGYRFSTYEALCNLEARPHHADLIVELTK